MRINLLVLALIGGLAVLAVSGCSVGEIRDTAREGADRTIGDALVRADGLHQDRREWDDRAQDLRKGFLDNCQAGASRVSAAAQTAEDWRVASEIWQICMDWHSDNGPPLLLSEILPELREIYKQLTDDQIREFGLPPRGNLR